MEQCLLSLLLKLISEEKGIVGKGVIPTFSRSTPLFKDFPLSRNPRLQAYRENKSTE